MTKRDLTDDKVDEPIVGDQMKKIAEALEKSKQQALRQDQPSNRASAARAPRQDREAKTREADATPLTWRPADVLPDPPQKDGWVHRWVRGSSRGELDSVNMARAVREGWQPVSAEDYPEISMQMFNKGESIGTIEFGGLILCRMPVELAKARDKYYKDLSLNQINSINARLREEQESDGRVKYENESRSRVNALPPR